MLVLFKKKKIVVDCFIDSPGIYNLFPIQKSKTFIPKWWKDLPQTYQNNNQNGLSIELPTMKSCEGFISLYKQGFILPLWADLVLEIYENGSWQYQSSDQKLLLDTHNFKEHGNNLESHNHFKIISPWLIKEKTGCKFLFIQPSWNNLSLIRDFSVLPGIVDYKFQYASHINFLIPKNTKRFEMYSGTPIAHIIPISDNDVEIKCHLIKSTEYENLSKENNYGLSFVNRYRNRKKILDSTKKCPFK